MEKYESGKILDYLSKGDHVQSHDLVHVLREVLVNLTIFATFPLSETNKCLRIDFLCMWCSMKYVKQQH